MQKTLVGALMLALAIAPASALARDRDGDRAHGKEKKNPFASIPVSSAPGSANPFSGTMDIVGWQQNAAGGIDAIGILNGTLAGMPVANQVITWPLAIPGASSPRAAAVGTQATCDILNLILGPLHLNLLGLNVDLNQVVLDITAQTGAGNLLGNLLCAVTGLLDAVAIGPILAGLLNNLTVLLGSLGL